MDADEVPLVKLQRKEAIKLSLLFNCLKVTSRIIQRKIVSCRILTNCRRRLLKERITKN